MQDSIFSSSWWMSLRRCHRDIQIAGLKKRHDDWVAEFLKISMKDGTPISAVTTPTGSCCGAEYRASETVGEYEKASAEQYRAGNEITMISPAKHSDGVGDDQSDKADRACDNNSTCGEYRCSEVECDSQCLNIHPESLRVLISLSQHVESAA